MYKTEPSYQYFGLIVLFYNARHASCNLNIILFNHWCYVQLQCFLCELSTKWIDPCSICALDHQILMWTILLLARGIVSSLSRSRVGLLGCEQNYFSNSVHFGEKRNMGDHLAAALVVTSRRCLKNFQQRRSWGVRTIYGHALAQGLHTVHCATKDWGIGKINYWIFQRVVLKRYMESDVRSR